MSRIFYFNITYGCNNDCVFCYSHNTTHTSSTFKEISFDEFSSYLLRLNLKKKDRVILNGGEPLLHSQLLDFLKFTDNVGCETLIYTNGRLLSKLYHHNFKNRFRVIVPIHGNEEIHDKIAGVKGSYSSTIQALKNISENSSFYVDIKLIINNYIISDDLVYEKFEESLSQISFNNCVHITKMADTAISKRNNIKSVDDLQASKYTKKLFDYYQMKNCKIKLFDTCIYDILEYYNPSINVHEDDIEVYFKDFSQERKVILNEIKEGNCSFCKYKKYCRSAVNEYKVLEYGNGSFYYGLE